MKKGLEQIAKEDDRYSAAAFKFVYEGLGYTLKESTAEPRHVSGRILCEGLKEFAMERYSRLAMLVLNTWGVKTTRDFGEIVYLMIDNEWMTAQPNDSINDFNDVYDFKTVFKDQFKF